MIREMTRYSFLLYHNDLDSFLVHLRELGMVDITTSSWVPSEKDKELLDRIQTYAKVDRAMASVAMDDDLYETQHENRCEIEDHAEFRSTEEAVDNFIKAKDLMESVDASIDKFRREIKDLEVWGDFNPSLIEKLKGEGLILRFFSVDAKGYDPAWEDQYPIEVVGSKGTNLFFVLVEENTFTQKLELGNAQEIKPPSSSANHKLEQIESLESTKNEINRVIIKATRSKEKIKEEYVKLKNEYNFSKVKNSGEKTADGTLIYMEGWSLKEDTDKILEFAQGQDVLCMNEAAKAEQNPPIKLKNNFFNRLYEPIGDLYMLPKYNELDMTPFFAPFFMIFFGMCFGDAGYGLLLILVIVALWRKIPQKFKDFAWLGIFLNIATIIFGILTGNFFGIELAKIPELVRFKEYFISNENMFNVAIGLGVAQVFFGMCVKIFNRSKKGGSFLYGLSSLGWVLLILFSGLAYLELTEWYKFGSTAYLISIAVAAVLIFFFNTPKKNPFVNFGKGLYNCYEMGTGVIGDLVSYVRLFAIGLSGAIIAQVFNALSVGLSGDIPVVSTIVMLIILVVGHGLNIFISALGAFVHPVRLTFVEFYKNAEFEGGGRKFDPFSKYSQE